MILEGVVVSGAGQAGSRFGVQTANLDLARMDANTGVYAVKILHNDKTYVGVCFIGKASLIDGHPWRVEVHLFDYYGKDLLDETICVETKKKIRDVIKFQSEKEAMDYIKDDIKQAKNYFNID